MDDDDDDDDDYWNELLDGDGHDPWQWADGVWCCEWHEQARTVL